MLNICLLRYDIILYSEFDDIKNIIWFAPRKPSKILLYFIIVGFWLNGPARAVFLLRHPESPPDICINLAYSFHIMIKPETIQRIIDTARIEEVIGDFVNLKKRGSNYVGLCPFHNEKTPSFSVSPAKGIYKCFGCGKAGNSVNFVIEHEHYSYPGSFKVYC